MAASASPSAATAAQAPAVNDFGILLALRLEPTALQPAAGAPFCSTPAAAGLVVSHASESAAALGYSPAELFDRPLASLVRDPAAVVAAAAALPKPHPVGAELVFLQAQLRDAAGSWRDADLALHWVELETPPAESPADTSTSASQVARDPNRQAPLDRLSLRPADMSGRSTSAFDLGPGCSSPPTSVSPDGPSTQAESQAATESKAGHDARYHSLRPEHIPLNVISSNTSANLHPDKLASDAATGRHSRLRLVVEIDLPDTRPIPQRPARTSFTLQAESGAVLTLPTIASDFYRCPSKIMRILDRVDEVLETVSTQEQRLVLMAKILRRMVGFDQITIYRIGNEMDMHNLFEEEEDHELTRERFNRPRYKASKFFVSESGWKSAVQPGWTRLVEDIQGGRSPIASRNKDEELPTANCILRPLQQFQINYISKIGSRGVFSLRLQIFGMPTIALSMHCANPMRVPFSCVAFFQHLARSFSISIEHAIIAEQIQAEQTLAKQTFQLLASEIDQTNDFKPYESQLVRKSCAVRLARCVGGLLPILSVDSAIIYLSGCAEIVQPGSHVEEIHRIVTFLRSQRLTRMLHSRCCVRDFPGAVWHDESMEKRSVFSGISGILYIPLSTSGDSFIALLRRQNLELMRSIHYDDDNGQVLAAQIAQVPSDDWTTRDLSMAKLLQVVFWSFVGSLQQREDGLRNEHLKTMLLADISHEVRTPLNAIVNFLEMMLDDPGSESFQELWKLALDASRSVVHIISELLLVTETGWGAVQMRREPFRIMDCIRSCAGMFPAACKNRGLRFSLAMSESNADAVVIGDQGKLRQVLTNLLGNAVKYTERGFVELQVESRVLGGSTLEVTLGVRDSGIGIPESKLGAIFDAFERITDVGDKRSEIEGAGLGLSICAKLASLMNGSLTVESTENVGSTFTFVVRMPLSEPEPRSLTGLLAAAALSSLSSSLPPLSIAIAEDNVANQRVIVLRLARDGHTTHVFDNGRALVDFVASAEQPRADLALVDLDMPGMQGTEVVRLIREAEANAGMPRIPVVAITASVSLADRDECIRAGMDGFLGKPLDFGVLRRMLADVADGSWQRRTGTQPAAYSSSEPPWIAQSGWFPLSRA
ncbi:hypothetical protein HK105_200807 [Polyrhizophydium stewartii]|uniref:Phytochrome n=1 Tax=Polyrhizophydium stewartii TaxID=2732419 RepID=A0ABR4NK78_9FUNG